MNPVILFRALLVSMVLLIVPLSLHAQVHQKVDGENIKRIIAEIASDEFQGRETGTKGCEMAEEYFAKEFRKLGLYPAGDSGTFFHHYVIPDPEAAVKATLVIDDRTFYQGYNEDFSVVYKSAWGEVEGEIVFAGYGIYNPEKNRNDYDSLDLKDKIVLIKRGAPRNDIPGWLPSCIDSVKAAYCYRNGAKGVLFFEPLIRTNQRVLRQSFGNHLAMVSVLPAFPIFSVDERVVRFIFTKSGQSYYRVINTVENQTASFSTGRTGKMTATGKNTQSIKARNVLGMIRGSDRKLRDEFVMIGGHIDHIGMDESGKIWNGADDNASGSAVFLGIAETMIRNNFKPKRSIVFVGWTGEEMGLLGSKAWCEHPTIDLGKVVVYFNLDMVGLGNGKLNMPGTGYAPEVTEFIRNNLDTSLLNRIVWSEGGPGGSDHNNFLMQGVPAFAGMTAGSHPDYHHPGDDVEKINTDILNFTGDFIYQSAAKIANAHEVFISDRRIEENKFRLFSFAFYNPIAAEGYQESLKNRNFKMGIVNLSGVQPSSDPNENFIALLNALDKGLKANNGVNKYVLTTSAYDVMMTRSGLLAAFNPDQIAMDELRLKVLARLGYRMAAIDSNSAACRDTSVLKKLLRICDENGLGLILDHLPPSTLESVTSLSSDPCLIIGSGVLSDLNARNIKEKGHLVIYQPVPATGIVEDTKNLNALVQAAGKNNILLSPVQINEESLKYLQRFIKLYNSSATDKELQYKLTGDNFYDYAVKSLQVN